MTDHGELELRHHFDDELEAIRTSLADMGTMVVSNIRHAGVVVSENRLDEVEAVKAADWPINDRYQTLEADVFQILALQQPVARDLRFLVAATRILYEMERSGDLAVNLVKHLDRIDGIPEDAALHSVLVHLIDAATRMFSRGVEAIATMDAGIGIGADAEDEETDRLTSELFSAVTERQDDLGLETAVTLFYIGRFLERIADHGVNIAQNITFVVNARFPEDD